MLFLTTQFAPKFHHFGMSVSEAVVMVSTVLMFIMVHHFWPYSPDQVREQFSAENHHIPQDQQHEVQ